MKRILVAEDDPASRELVVELLRAWGYEVVEAADGREALDKMKQQAPDLALLDVQMPFVDGVGVVQQLRQDAQLAGVRAVALTAQAMQGDRERFLAAGFDAYLSKPVDPAGLRAQLRQLLG